MVNFKKTRIPLFRRFVLQNFPFIEQDFDALTDYELICKVVEYLNKVIVSTNANSEQVEILTEAFNELQSYVDHYFENLDVQDEINNKLDQMTEDGTLQEIITAYLNSRAIFAFDTVAEMKAATNLTDGSFAQTLGYYTRNDGGAGLYKIVTDNSISDDGGSVISLNNGCKALLVYESSINIGQFGIDSTHITNLSNLCSFIENSGVPTLELNATTYPIDKDFTLNVDTLTIDGKGGIIEPTSAVGDFRIFNITGNDITIKNITIDGSNIPTNQWSVSDHSDLVIRRCFDITSSNIKCENVIINNVWGEGIICRGYNNVLISKCRLDKIGGGFYKTDSAGFNDYFGDGLYFSGHNNDANVVIENCYIEGFQETGVRTRGSRGGVVFENLQSYTNGLTTVTMNNTQLNRFNRAIHVENFSGGQLTLNCSNSNVLQDCSITSTTTPKPIINFYYSKVIQTAENYNNSHGMANFIVNYYNSDLEIQSGATYAIGQNNTIAKFINSNIYGIKDMQISVATVDFINSNLYFDNSTSYTIYSSTVHATNCNFYNSENSLKTIGYSSGGHYICENCKFYDIIPNVETLVTSNILYTHEETISQSNLANPQVLGMFTVYVNMSTLYSTPNISLVLDATDEYNNKNTSVTQEFGDNASLPIIPANLPTNFKPKLSRRYALIITGTSDPAAYYLYKYDRFYYCELKYDQNGAASIGQIQTTSRDPAGESHKLSFDEVNGTVSKGATYSQYVDRVVYRIIPYEWLSSLGSASL